MSDETQEEITMIRKVYMLPRELVDRIASFQHAKRLPSEVEAVRRLLDEALLYRDTPTTVIERFKERLKGSGLLRSVAKDLLSEHPLVLRIAYDSLDSISFELKDWGLFRIDSDGSSFVHSDDFNGGWDTFPPVTRKISPPKSDMDDEIPF